MRDGWERTALGRVARQVVEPVAIDSRRLYSNLGVKWYAAGTFLREPKLGSEIKASRLYRVRPGQFVYNRLFATEGSFALVRPEDEGAVASNEFPVFDIDRERLLPEYLALHFQQPSVWHEVHLECTGTTKSRLRWKEERFAAHTVLLPRLCEQRRIVDLIGTLDDTIASAEATASSARRSATSMLIHPMWEIADTVPLESVFEHVIGGTWGDPPGLSEVPVLALGPKSYAGRVDVDADTTTLRSLPSKRAAGRMLRPGDIVLERSGGSPTQPVGRVIRMSNEGASNVVPSDFQRLLRPNPSRAHPDFVFWSMWANYESGVVVPFQKATTSIRNLNIPQYLSQVRIALPAHAEQVKFAALAESYMALVRGHEHQASQLLEVRSSLLDVLLSGEHEIPESYDELVGVAS